MPRRYKLGPDGEMRRAWGGKLPEEFDQRDMLAFMAETDLQLQGAVSAETLSAIQAAGYDYKGGAVIPRPGKEEQDLNEDVLLTPEQIPAADCRGVSTRWRICSVVPWQGSGYVLLPALFIRLARLDALGRWNSV